VTIKNYTFLPHRLHVRVGTTVTWTNLDTNVGHTVTSGTSADTRRWRSSGLFFGGQRFSVTFRRPGTYPYFCMPHFYNPAMHGVIVVGG
jgi:plastocyanin